MVTQNKLHSPELNIAPRNDSKVQRNQTHSGQDNAVTGGDRNLPLITLPPRLPKQQQRRTQFPDPRDRSGDLRERIHVCKPGHVEALPARLLQDVVQRRESAHRRPMDADFLNPG